MAVLRLIISSNFVGGLDRQVSRFLALEDAVDVPIGGITDIVDPLPQGGTNE